MPLYEYAVVHADGTHGPVFEVLQLIHEPPLTVHPETGEPVERLISSANMSGRWSEAGMAKSTSDKRLKELGFQKYVRDDNGQYRETLGNGKDLIKKPAAE